MKMRNVTKLLPAARTPAAALLLLIGLSACSGADKNASNGTAAENVSVPADESAARDDSSVAAEMHNRMAADQNQGMGASSGAMADDQMGSSMGNAQSSGMPDDSMPMGGGNMASGMGNMADHHKGMKGGSMSKPMPKPSPDKPMQDDM